MREQDCATSQFPLWWDWYKASLTVWNNLLPDGINPSQGRHSLSPWLAWNAASLQAWNRILLPWLKTPLFAQVLGTLAETYCDLSAASSGLAQTEQAMQAARSELLSDQENGGQLLPPGVGQTPRRLVWTKKPARLYHYDESVHAPRKYRTPLLMVYALINKPYILDLLPGRSLIDYLWSSTGSMSTCSTGAFLALKRNDWTSMTSCSSTCRTVSTRSRASQGRSVSISSAIALVVCSSHSSPVFTRLSSTSWPPLTRLFLLHKPDPPSTRSAVLRKSGSSCQAITSDSSPVRRPSMICGPESWSG